ncbi:MAG: zonular occludens toxin domain-containing protein [Nanoarchaeota archaeon]
MKKSNKKKEMSNTKTILKAIWLIIKIPYYIVMGISKLQDKLNEKEIKQKVEKQRDSKKPIYQSFKLIETKSGDYKEYEKYLLSEKSKIGIILGARGTGKTAIGIKVLENIYAKSNRKIYAIGFKSEDMPSWIEVITSTDEIKNNSTVLIDEGGVLFSSRNAMTAPNKLLSQLILIARHKNLSILFISQNSSNLDVNILRQADHLILKPTSLLQEDFERKKIRDIYQEASQDFRKHENQKGLTYIYSEIFRGFVANPLPSFWTTNISKSFR